MAKKRELTPLEWRFVQQYNGHGDGYAAALRAGAAKSNAKQWASRILKRADIKAAIKHKLDVAATEVGKNLGRAIDIDRNEIIMGLADIARDVEKTPPAVRVAAYRELKDIFGLSAKNDKDTDLFAGWSTEELSEYAHSGELPLRLRPGTIQGKGSIPLLPPPSE